KHISSFKSKILLDFVTKQSLNLFSTLKLSQNFLCLDPEVWPQLEDYNNAKEIV
ncbi:hypothetical protein HELRODRAFT_127890, partial [Helobdella robusta]|uniref:Uncharacterized protein n=1 Tax=Helobdella robusta TaxID=6412 RepID=T1EHJ6_HELRO